jgi:hypothetical protein
MHLSYGTGTDEDRRKYWNFGKDSNLIGLDRLDVNTDWNDKTEAEKKKYGSQDPTWYRQFEMFCNKMTKGDLVVVMAGLDSILGIGKVSKADYYYCPKFKEDKSFFDHVRNIRWGKIWNYDNKHRPKLPEPLMIFSDTLRCITTKSKFWKVLYNADL